MLRAVPDQRPALPGRILKPALGAIMDLDIRGLRVLVTAGAGGIGLAIARGFVGEGARVHVCDIDAAALSALAASDPVITSTRCDVSDRATVQHLFEEATAKLGGLDVLVNNAGIAGPTGKIEEIHPEDWDRCLEICLTGQFNCARLAVPHLRASKNASIVNISSAAGRLGFAMRTPYAAAKWGVIGLTKSLSIELGPDHIRVNAILPGLVAGDRQRRVLEAKAQQRGISYAEMERVAFSYTSIKDYVTPEQIADQILLLCSPRGRTISGQAISICGDTKMLG
jgi:NAD(P)-dependent dehydrogenase (short-subunit alcohol dehydrogenase family)